MELREMICLCALCDGPLKDKVMGFWVGARAGVCVHSEAPLHPSYQGRAASVNTYCEASSHARSDF